MITVPALRILVELFFGEGDLKIGSGKSLWRRALLAQAELEITWAF